jgi:DNA modification methylase
MPYTYILNQIVLGDAKVLAETIASESVDLIFSDPVYDRREDYACQVVIGTNLIPPGLRMPV